MQRITALWNKGVLGKVTIVLVGLVVVCCVLGALVGRGGSQQQTANTFATIEAGLVTAPPAAAAATALSEATEAPAAPAGPTDTPAPTNTPAPTDTPEPTVTPTPLPEPISLSGRGKTVTDPFALPAPASRVSFTHNGSRNFAVTLYVNGEMTDLLVNTIGSYEGARPLITTDEVFLEIDADGDWTATIEPLTQDDSFAAGAEGSGDFVSPLFMPSGGATPFTFTHTGKRNFAVFLRCAGGMDLVANEIGATDGQVVVRFSDGPCLWDVQADGDWTLKPK